MPHIISSVAPGSLGMELGLRPVSQVFNQIRYWSALDDPEQEKWDYVSHYTRTERRGEESAHEA